MSKILGLHKNAIKRTLTLTEQQPQKNLKKDTVVAMVKERQKEIERDSQSRGGGGGGCVE